MYHLICSFKHVTIAPHGFKIGSASVATEVNLKVINYDNFIYTYIYIYKKNYVIK